MKLYVAYFHPESSARAGQPPVMLSQGISWRCLLFGWLGLLLSASWIAGLLAGAVTIALAVLLGPVSGGWPLLAGLQLLLGLFGNDLRAWELRLRGLIAGPVVAGADADAALARLLDQRPELIGSRA